MASRLTIRCRDAEEAKTLLALMEQRSQGEARRRYSLAQACVLVEAVMADESENPDVVQIAAEAIAALIVRHLEPRLLNKLIARRVMDMGEEELEQIRQIGVRMLNGSGEGEEGTHQALRQAGIIRRVSAFLREEPHLDVNGFFHFRLPDYRADVAEVVDAALEEYAADRQYREFIALLKYFVYFQDVKIPGANLIHCGDNRYAMFDHRMQPLERSGSEEVTVEEVDRALNYEDMIVSTLISASPRHIMIHTREPDTLSIRTIRHIFEGRTTLCTDCHLCKPLLDRKEERGLP